MRLDYIEDKIEEDQKRIRQVIQQAKESGGADQTEERMLVRYLLKDIISLMDELLLENQINKFFEGEGIVCKKK